MIDLHTHTTVSDGGDSPRALAKAAAMANLSVVAVTDHDNDSGCTEAVEEGRSCDVEDLGERGYSPRARPTMHLLGYFVPEDTNPLSDALADLQWHRANRNQIIVDRLNELGIPVTFEE